MREIARKRQTIRKHGSCTQGSLCRKNTIKEDGMPNDYITLKALACELNESLSGGKIDKVNMPEKDEIALLIRAQGKNRILTVSCNASNPRIHTDGDKKQNPMVAPSFCMHLRKHITGGIINSVKLLGEDRIVAFDITSRNEMRDEVNLTLIAEMMGRYSNILLLKKDGVISDTLKQVSYDTMTKRCLLAGAKYSLPPQNKLLPSDKDGIKNALKEYCASDVATYLISRVSGLSLLTAKQIVTLCEIKNDSLSLDDTQIDRLCDKLNEFININASSLYSPCVYRDKGVCKDFFVMPYVGFDNIQKTPSLNDAVVLCTVEKDREERKNERTKFLKKAYDSLIKKLNSKLAKDNEKLTECEQTENIKKYGELILSNLHAINKGDEKAVVTDYCSPDCPEITVKLDTRLTPQQNAQAYFKKYAKLKRTYEVVSKQIEEVRETLEYAQTIAPAIALCSTDDEIEEVRQELAQLGALKQIKTQKNKFKPSQPVAYEVDDFVILVGKNNIQNEKLTFKVANGSDIWIHTQKVHGSHTIIFAEGRQIPDKVIQTGCEIAAYYSQGRDGDKIACDYTRRKNLRRHPSGKPGMVLYTTYKTAVVTPNEHREYLTKFD